MNGCLINDGSLFSFESVSGECVRFTVEARAVRLIWPDDGSGVWQTIHIDSVTVLVRLSWTHKQTKELIFHLWEKNNAELLHDCFA